MRHYPRNSPEAAARLLALCMVADGHVCRSEVEALRRWEVEAQLGLPPGGLGPVLQTLCEDLLCAQTSGSLSACLDDSLLEALLRDVDDPALQRKVIDAMAATAAADGHLSDGEQQVLQAMQRDWRFDWQTVLARQPVTPRA
ncbi:TerB family tellurite resistance protein [Ideonella sp.]|uniref:tellurite resistance TerB family protein n=1 Tax=Ideonella sp. TaxID=1929293 RepID=UPI0035B3A8D2